MSAIDVRATLTPEQKTALDAFIAEHGEYWKEDLRTAWLNASAEPLLHQLRNSHGDAWLCRYGVKVGDGATICYFSDRRAATIIRMTATTITVQEDHSIRTDKNGMSDCQSYRYERNPDGPITVFRLRKTGHYHAVGQMLVLGHRRSYYDYSF